MEAGGHPLQAQGNKPELDNARSPGRVVSCVAVQFSLVPQSPTYTVLPGAPWVVIVMQAELVGRLPLS
jgi:hypothetical protein